MTLGVSIREFARREGCDDKLVRRALAKGGLARLADGSLDPALVGGPWRRRQEKRAEEAPPPAEIQQLPEAREADLPARLAAGRVNLVGADRVKANALALKHLLAARKAAGQLIDAQAAEEAFFQAARDNREAWSNWPARIAPLIAADLDVPADQLAEVLSRHVHAHLAELGEPDGEFQPG